MTGDVAAGAISVVIPTFDDGHLIQPCLESIARQTMPPTEIIVVDDGSTKPDALSALRRAEERYPSVRLIRQANAGPAAARNRGLAECRGDFVVFVDADDSLAPESLAQKSAMFSLEPSVAATFSGFLAVWPDGRQTRSSWRDYLGPLQPDLIGRPGGVPGGLPLYMFRTEALKAIGGLDEHLRVMEDFDLLIRLGRRGGLFAGNNDPTYVRAIRPGSISRGSRLRTLRETLRFLAKARRERYFTRGELLRRYMFALGHFARSSVTWV